jgi:hypothetical protein
MLRMFEIDLIWKKYKQPKFQDNKRPNFETPTWESKVKVSFRCNPHGESHNKLQGGEWCLFPKVMGRVKLVHEVVLTKSTTPLAFNLD